MFKEIYIVFEASLNRICFMYASSMVMGKPLASFSRVCFPLVSSEYYEPQRHGWYGTTMVSVMNRLIAKLVQGFKLKRGSLKCT